MSELFCKVRLCLGRPWKDASFGAPPTPKTLINSKIQQINPQESGHLQAAVLAASERVTPPDPHQAVGHDLNFPKMSDIVYF